MLKKIKRQENLRNFKFFGAGFLIIIISISIIWIASIKIPDFKSFNERKITNSTKIYDRTGEILLYDIHQDVKRTNIPFEQMGTNIKNATIAIEDANFYNHKGIRVTSIVRAVLSNVFNIGIGGGGSTITQQLVKNTLLTQKKSYIRKIKEWVLAIKIDHSMPKDKILEAYLNEIPYGGSIYGIEEAAKTYFNKNAENLSLAEAAYLASIPQSPTTLSPYGKNKNKLEERKNLVLSRMFELNFITKSQYDTAKSEKVEFQPQAKMGIRAPHFVFFIKDYLMQKYGENVLENGGLKVTTTLDYDLEEKAEKAAIAGALENEKSWNGSNTSIVVIDPKTGQILTMVGSRDYFDKNIDGNFNVATATRQPGSSFKPFIYATAFGKGFTPDTVLFDLPTEFQTTCNEYGKALPGHNQSDCYMPDNYDGKHRGPISLRDALAQSINIPAVKLLYLVTIKDAFKTSQDMGITTLSDPNRYGLTLVIGGGEVSLLDMTSAYGVFANNGNKNNYTGILKIEDGSGNILEQYKQNEKKVLEKNVALTVSDVLSDNKARVPTFGSGSSLEIPKRQVAVKTGTTNNNKDAWTIGYTPSVVVGVWAGNNDNTPMKKGGSAVAGPIWNKVMSETLAKLPNENFEKPDLTTDPLKIKPVLRGYWQGNEHYFVDKISGKLATEYTPRETKVEKVITNVHSILYWVDREDVLGNPPKNPFDNTQFNHWEIPIQNWWNQNKYKYQTITWADAPSQIDDIHTEALKPVVYILQPDTETYYNPNERIQLITSSTGRFPLQKIEIFINDTYLGSSLYPFNFSFLPSDLENLKDVNEIRIVAYDTAYNYKEIISTFKILNN